MCSLKRDRDQRPGVAIDEGAKGGKLVLTSLSPHAYNNAK